MPFGAPIVHWQPHAPPLVQVVLPHSPPEQVPPTKQAPAPLQVPGRQVPVGQRASACPNGVAVQRESDPHRMQVLQWLACCATVQHAALPAAQQTPFWHLRPSAQVPWPVPEHVCPVPTCGMHVRW